MANEGRRGEINPHQALQEMARGSMVYTDTFRRFFGETSNNAEPMISGFGILFFTQLPTPLNDSTNVNYLTAVTTTLELPDMSIDVITYEGRDGGQWHVPGAVKMGGDLTLTLWELKGLPTYRTINRWVSIMRNPLYGYMTDVTWNQANYKGKLLYAICTPDLQVQMAKVYSGIWPTEVRDSVFRMDQNQEKIEYQATFKFDHYPYTSEEVISTATALVENNISNLTNIIGTKYKDAANAGTAGNL